jgi:virulence factor
MGADTVRVGVVGLGFIAQRVHLPTLANLAGVRISALCDVNEQTLRDVASTYRVDELYTDPVAMATQAGCEAVLVLTKPITTHAPIAIAMLEHGKDVLCEKPMATTLHDAKAMVAAAERGSRIFMIGFNRRYMPICQQAKALFRDRPADICRITFTGGKPRAGALLDNPHPVDLARYFAAGEATSVRCSGRLHGAGEEANIVAVLEFDSGMTGLLLLSNDAGGPSESVELHGGGLSVQVDIGAQTLRLLDRAAGGGLFDPQRWVEDRPSKWIGFQGANGFAGLVEEFVECVRTRREPGASGADAYRSHELVSQIYEAVGLPAL